MQQEQTLTQYHNSGCKEQHVKKGIIRGGHGNRTGRTVAVYRVRQINAPALTCMFKQIAANNRAGGLRKLKIVDDGTG